MQAMLLMKNNPLNTFGIDTTAKKSKASKLYQEFTEQMGSQVYIDRTILLLLYFHLIAQYFLVFFVSLTYKTNL